jgi:predicted enzyme related to lactoylglutathione lyase
MGEGTPAAWTAGFWVHDVDAAVETAARTGGRALVEPFDHEVGRTAVLADPAGATFSITAIGARA